MIFRTTALDGVWIVEGDPKTDNRGFFARTYCEREFSEYRLCTNWVQANTCVTRRRGTLRGLHLQAAPHGEIKLVRCVRGEVFDVVVDLRPASPSFGQWAAFELTATQLQQLYIPAGCAHGYQTLSDDVEMLYNMSAYYVAEAAIGIHWATPALGIPWPILPPLISTRDDALPKSLDRLEL